MNIFTRNKYFYIQIFAIILIAGLTFIRVPLLSSISGFIYLFFIPGYLIYKIIDPKKSGFWEKIIHSVGISVFFVMMVALIINISGSFLGILDPLSSRIIHVVFSILILLLAILEGLIINKSYILPKINFDYINHLPDHFFLILLPVLSMVGVTTINNGGGSTVIVSLILIIVSLTLYILYRCKYISEEYIMSCIYFISLSLLLMTSMRGHHVIGYDINKELRVFNLTQGPMFWSMSHLKDAYNACLSITILPTITSEFVSISNEYIYKFLFQIIFALMPVVLYQLVRKFADKKVSILATLFCVFQVWFFQNMPALIRQEFGILFFTLILATIFDNEITSTKKFLLAGLYGWGMIISHYSTTYIAILLFIGVYIANLLLKKFSESFQEGKTKYFISNSISLSYLLFLVASLLIWNTYFTGTSNNFTEFLSKSSNGISKVISTDNMVQSLSKLLYPPKDKTDLNSYIAKETTEFKFNHPEYRYYENNKIPTNLKSLKYQDVKGVYDGYLRNMFLTIFKLIKIIVNDLFIISGVLFLFIQWKKDKFKSSEYILLAIAGMVFIFLLIAIPGALHDYNLERLYFQMLIIWALFGVIGGVTLFEFVFDKKISLGIVTAIYILMFMFYSGIIFNFTGGPAIISMHNYGEDFDKFYTFDEEVVASEWLNNNRGIVPIFTNSVGINKLMAYSLIPRENIFNQTLPSLISKRSFVFLTYMNTIDKIAVYEYNGDEYAYTYPNDFLSKNKDKVYTNGISEIYR